MKILIISAMEVEQEELVKELKDLYKSTPEEKDYGITKATVLCIEDRTLYFSICGIGKTNAAASTAVLIREIQPDLVINYGLAAGLDPEHNIGDTVISSSAVYHDMDVSALGYPLGCVPHKGFEDVWITSSIDFTQEFLKATDNLASVHVGKIATGDQFLSSDEKKRFITEVFGANCVEMEGAAIAHVCKLFDIPFILVRIISDNGDDLAAETYSENENEIMYHFTETFINFLSSIGGL